MNKNQQQFIIGLIIIATALIGLQAVYQYRETSKKVKATQEVKVIHQHCECVKSYVNQYAFTGGHKYNSPIFDTTPYKWKAQDEGIWDFRGSDVEFCPDTTHYHLDLRTMKVTPHYWQKTRLNRISNGGMTWPEPDSIPWLIGSSADSFWKANHPKTKQ